MQVVREGGAVVVPELELAASFLSRLRGLMGRAALRLEQGLWLEPCASIHMMFVTFPIDVVFLRRLERGRPAPGASAEVLKVCPEVRPWLGLASCLGATTALELPAGRAAALALREGDLLALRGAP